MSLTGGGIQIGIATQFGQGIRFPRGLASDGTTVYLFESNRANILDPLTGEAERYGTPFSNVNESQCRSAVYHDNKLIFYGNSRRRLYEMVLVGDDIDAVTLTASLTSTYDFWGLASLNDRLYGLDRNTDALYIIDIDTDTVTRVGDAVEFGLPGSANLQGFCAYRGELIAASTALDMIVRMDPATGIASEVSTSSLPDNGPEALVEHNGQLLMAGSGLDALFRLYDVRWNDSIPDIEVESGGNTTLDLETVSQDATSFEFALTNTAQSWISLLGTELSATIAPTSLTETDFEVILRAIRGSKYEEKTLTIRVAASAPASTVPGAPTDLVVESTTDDSVTISLTASTDNGGSPILRYEYRLAFGAWIELPNANTTFTIPNLDEDTAYIVQVRAVNQVGPSVSSSAITARTTVSIVVPGVPTALVLSVTETEITATWQAAVNNGGENPIRYDVRIDGGAWVDAGLDLTHTFSGLVGSTAYTVEVAEVNSAGRGPATSLTDSTSAPPILYTVPGAPTNLRLVSKTATTFRVAIDAPADDGGDTILRYDYRLNNAAWTIRADAATEFDITGLVPDTEYVIFVRGVNGVGPGAASGSITETTNPPPIVVPSAPTSLSLTATETEITATWQAAVNNGGEAPIRYDVRIDGGAWVDAGLDLTHTFSSLSPETEYTLDVAEVNSAGRGAIISVTESTAAVPIVVPSAPTSLSLTATETEITATWQAAVNNGGEAPIRYDVRIDGGAWQDAGLDFEGIFSGLSAATAYQVEVAEVNSAGRGAVASAMATTDATPVVLSLSLNVPTGESGLTFICVLVSNLPIAGVDIIDFVLRRADGVFTNLDTHNTVLTQMTGTNNWQLEITLTGKLDHDFQLRLRANQIQQNGVNVPAVHLNSEMFHVTSPDTVPGAPTNLRVISRTTTRLRISFTAGDDGGDPITHYEYRLDDGAWVSRSNDDTVFNITGLTPETEYDIEVRGVNGVGAGPASPSITETTDAEIVVPGAPRNLSLSATETSLTATWQAAANNGGEAPSRYDIRIDGGPWVNAGLDLEHIFSGLSAATEYQVEAAEVNSAGRGSHVSDTASTSLTAPGRPTHIEVELQSTTGIFRWTAATGGGAVDTYEISYAEGTSPGTTWIATGSTGTRFFVKGLKRGTQYTFRVRGRNAEGAGSASATVTERTPIASLNNCLFFKECVNYLDNGGRVSEHGNPSNIIRAVADNDYKTFSTVRDYAIDMSRNNQPTRVDAVFIKSKGITRHSGTPTGGSGTGWTNEALPATVKNWEGTHISTTVLGFQHHLLLMDQHFTATSVRVRFEGTNVELYEIMLLEFGISIDANGDFTEIATNFVDRTGVVHPDAGSGIAYTSPIGSERDKWEVDYVVRVVPGKTMLETPEDFLYWRAKNRNHVFCMEPSRFPWRIFPAVFVGKSVPIRYRTDSKTSGEILSFRVAEQ